MAAAAVISMVAGPIVNELCLSLTKWIEDECFGFMGVKQDLEKLSSTFTTIHAVLEDAEKKQLKSQALSIWLGKLRDVALDAQDVLELHATEAMQWKKKPQVTNILYKISTAHKIKQLVERVQGIAEENEKFHLTASLYHSLPDSQQHNHPQTTHHVYEPNIVGREADKEKIIEMLQSDADSDISVIPIFGMGGLGKTTLAQLVYNDERVGEEQFMPRMWASVGPKFDLRKIIIEMIESFSKAKDNNLINSSLSNLKDSLGDILGRNRFLLVLDNVWEYDAEGWEQLENVLIQGGGKGSKILITTRILTVCQKMGTQDPYKLGYLSQVESFSLFKRIALVDHLKPRSEDGQRKLEGIGEQIVGKCSGLPLAIKALGALLRGNTDVGEWEGILCNDIWEIEGDKAEIDDGIKILPALKLSYDHLPSILKQCFAYCSIFPKSYVFIKEELVKLWMAQGFVQQKIRQQRTEETGMEYFDRLFGRSFFQPSQQGTYMMHDLIHDLALSISSPLHCQVKDPNSLPAKTSRHVSVVCKDVVRNIARGSKKLRTLLLPGSDLENSSKVLDMIFHHLPYVRALDLSSSSLTELPKSVEELKLLHYLNLSNTEITTLPNSVCNLYHLETLKLLGCVWLPNNLGNLAKLRHLELDDVFWLKSFRLPPRMGNLTNLHDLHAFQVGRDNDYQLQELQNMANLTGELRIAELQNAVNSGAAALDKKKSLDTLIFEWSANKKVNPQDEASDEMILTELKPHSNIKALKICHYRGTAFPIWIESEWLRNLVALTLKGCTSCTNLSLGKLPCLRQLYIKGMHALERWVEIEAMQYGSLDTLKISDCPGLMELPKMFPSLKVMKVKKCRSLKALPVTPSLQLLILLHNLVLENWNETRVPIDTINDQGQTFVSRLPPLLLELLDLKIVCCPKLRDLPRVFLLQKLEISKCKLITVLPDPEYAQPIHMALNSCHDGMLLRLLPNASFIQSLVLSNISNIASPPKWPSGLKDLYISSCARLVSLADKESPLHRLTSLVMLSVRDCPKLVTLQEEGLPTTLECLIIDSCSRLTSLGPKETLLNLTSLKDLYIEDCPLFQPLPEDNLPESLQHLHIHGCRLLRDQCHQMKRGDPELVANRHIPDNDFHFNQVPSIQDSGRQMAPSAAWYHPLICSKAMEHEGDMEPAQFCNFAEISKIMWKKKKKKERAEAAAELNNNEDFLEHMRMKKWVDKNSGEISYMLYARSLSISWGDDKRYWTWNCFKETSSDENVEVAKLLSVCWLDVRGRFQTSKLSPGVKYEIAYQVKLTKSASGWERPLTFRMRLPNGTVRERQVILQKPKERWFELNLGNFLADGKGKVWFDLMNHGGHWKKGLLIKGVVIRPKTDC